MPDNQQRLGPEESVTEAIRTLATIREELSLGKLSLISTLVDEHALQLIYTLELLQPMTKESSDAFTKISDVVRSCGLDVRTP